MSGHPYASGANQGPQRFDFSRQRVDLLLLVVEHHGHFGTEIPHADPAGRHVVRVVLVRVLQCGDALCELWRARDAIR